MTMLLAGLGPAGRGVLTAMYVRGMLPGVCGEGLVVVDPDPAPGGGSLREYAVRSDSAAIVFAHCIEAFRHEPTVTASASLARVRSLPDGDSILLPHVGQLLDDSTPPLLREARRLGADVRLGTRLTALQPLATGGAVVTVSDGAGEEETLQVERLVLALGGRPYVPKQLTDLGHDRVRHSDSILRAAGLLEALQRLPPDPRIVVVGRAHSAFSVADQLLSSAVSHGWAAGAVTMAARGPVRVTYPSAVAALADGARFTREDICPQSHRVWRLCGLRGDAARRYRLGRDGLDPRLTIGDLHSPVMADRLARADLVVAATGYRPAAMGLLPAGVSISSDGSFVDASGAAIPGIRSIGLWSGSRRNPAYGGEPSYTGPVDGVWHYQNVLAPTLLDGLLEGDRVTVAS